MRRRICLLLPAMLLMIITYLTFDSSTAFAGGYGLVGDLVWHDLNGNGIQEAGEPGIADVTVQLKDCSGHVLRTTTTSASGTYFFDNLDSGCYTIGVVVSSAYVVSPLNKGGDDSRDSDINPVSIMSDPVNLAQGENNLTVDVGLYQPNPKKGSLGDRVWLDDNADGIQNDNEAGVAGVTVQLKDCNNALLKTTTTNANGNYTFPNLDVGCYVVRFVNINSNDFSFTTPNQGVDDAKDSDITQLDSVTPGIVNGQTEPIFLAQGEHNPTIDAGLVRPRYILGDRVWYDQNQNGIQDDNEPGYNGVTVQLFTNATCSDSPVANTTTAAGSAGFGNGYYQFGNLLAGTYSVKFSGIPTGWSISSANQGGDNTRDSNANAVGCIENINLTANDPNEDLGIFVAGTLGDSVVCTSTGQGLANITVNLFKDFNSDGVADGPVFKAIQTNASGFYQFTGLEVALVGDPNNTTKYIVRVDTNDPDLGACNVPVPPTEYNPPLTSDNPNNPNNDFKFEKPATAVLGDFVWNDLNRNGVQDGGEPGISGVTVMLLNCSGAQLASTTTNATGLYSFPNLNAGCYVVMFNAPSGFVFSPANQGGDDTKDSDADSTGKTSQINLAPGENNTTVDAGLNQPAASLGDRVFEDRNGNGIQDEGEPGLPGVTVQLLNPGADNNCNTGNEAGIATTTTNGDGLYEFSNLASGRYCVRFMPPAGYVISPANQGGDDTKDSDADPATGQTSNINLASGQNDPTNDAGLYRPASLGDRVFEDRNNNGIQDVGEPGIPGVTVQLKDCSGNILTTTTTDANDGIYTFANLKPGCYSVGLVPPGGYTVSPVDQGSDDAKDSDINPTTNMSGPVTLISGQNNNTVDAGLIPPAQGSIGDRVWRDDNGDGIQNAGEPGIPGVTVQLKDCNNNVLRTTTTDNNGNYSFTGLTAGCYRIGVIPNGFTISPANQGSDDARDSDVDPNTAMTDNINLAQGENNPTVDVGLRQPMASLGDFVFEDRNQNGIQDGGEPGISGVTVMLLNCSGAQLASTTTNATGLYNFPNLNAGCYVVMFNAPSGFVFSPANQGGDDTKDSDADSTGKTSQINLAPGENNTTIDAGLSALLACGLTVDQKCTVASPPPSSNFVCQNAKPLNELSMVWNGSQNIDVKAWKGSVGSTLLATVTNVAPGQVVTVSGYAGSPNDVIWEIFVAGTSNKLGESTFHLSCSDENMDGPEDCGVAEGDGKGKTGFLNLWKLEGLAGNGLRLACTSTPPAPADSCTIVSAGGSVCNGSKPKSLTFRYTGGSCADTTNSQNGKFKCTGNPGSGTVTIALTKDANKYSITPSNVSPGQEFTIARIDGSTFSSDTPLQVGSQSLSIHTSCSQALNLGDVFGSLVLVGADGQRLDTPVTFNYLVANSGDALSNVSLQDNFGAVTAPFSLAKGASQNFQRQTTIANTLTNLAVVKGFLANGQMCQDSDGTTVVIEPAPLSCEDGKPTALTFEYTGGSCSDTTNTQNGKFSCSGDPGPGMVSVTMQKDADKISVNPSTVASGQRFTIARTDSKEFASDTLLQVGGQSLKIHTSCSQQLNVGDVFGSLRLVTFTPKGFSLSASSTGNEMAEAHQLFLPLIEQQ